ncbi:hypothetical protein WJX79_009039 [Trebouxia sp. C0005]
MQKPLQLRSVTGRPVQASCLRPRLAAHPQQQPRLRYLFSGRHTKLSRTEPSLPVRGRTQTRVTALQTGKLSRRRPNTAWSPIRSAFSLSKFFIITASATASACGNTMAFLYDRQKEMVKHLYHECMSLEELLEESVNTLGPDARDILAQVRLYIEEEIYAPENQSPPLGEGFALAAIRSKARNYRRAGTDVGEILQASQRLAHAQSERQATACRLLPPVHWALLYTIGALFVSTFILFETGGSFSNEGRHILFTVLCGLMSFVLCALRDLADPAEGVYNATALLDERLKYIIGMLDKYQKVPGGIRTSNSGVSESDAGKDGKLLLGGQRSSIATELTDFRRQTQNSNNAV